MVATVIDLPSIGGYTATIKVVLVETGKYVALVMFSVLAIRLWRGWRLSPAEFKAKNLTFACVASLIAITTGCVSIRHSLGLLYSHYGTESFGEKKIEPALSLFQTSLSYWKSADTLGKEGLCLMWLDKTNEGIYLLGEANALRGGKSPAFEEFYEGLYFFYHDQMDRAVPMLEAVSADLTYSWNVTKLFAIVQLDRGQPQEAAKLMAPFMQAEIRETDQAYIMASLEFYGGKKTDALALVEKFSTGDNPYWKSRFDRLRAQIQKQP